MDRLRSFLASLRALLALGVAHGVVPSAGSQVLDPERRAWQRALEEGTPEAFQAYLDAYPLGRYATEAFRELIARTLGARTAPVPPAEPTEAAPPPSGLLY